MKFDMEDVTALDEVFRGIAYSIGGPVEGGKNFHVPTEDIHQIIWALYLEGKFNGYCGESDNLKHFASYVRKITRNHLIQSEEGRRYNSGLTVPYLRGKKSEGKDENNQSLYWDLSNPYKGTLNGSAVSIVELDYEPVVAEDKYELTELDEVREFLLSNIDRAPLLNAFLVLGLTPLDFFFDEIKKEFLEKNTGRYPKYSFHAQIPTLMTKIIREEINEIDSSGTHFPVFYDKSFAAAIKSMVFDEKVFVRDDAVVSISKKLHQVKSALISKGIDSRKVMRWVSWAHEFPQEICEKIYLLQQKNSKKTG